MNGFAGDGGRRVGNASLLNAIVDGIGRDLGYDVGRIRAVRDEICAGETCAAGGGGSGIGCQPASRRSSAEAVVARYRSTKLSAQHPYYPVQSLLLLPALEPLAAARDMKKPSSLSIVTSIDK